MTIGQLLRAAIQAFYFILIARALGPSGYGGFVAVAALVAVTAPFVGVGSGNILISRVARESSSFSVNWGNSLLITGVSGGLLLMVVLLIADQILPIDIPRSLVVIVGITDLFFSRILDLSGQAAQAREDLGLTAGFMVFAAGARAIAAVLLVVSTAEATALRWSVFYLISSIIPAVIAAMVVTRRYGRPRIDAVHARQSLTEGFYFSIGLSSQTTYNDIDKTLLASLENISVAGTYGAAYRIIDAAFMPIRALHFASYARFFQHGSSGLLASASFGKRLLPPTLSYGVVMALGLWFVAPWVPDVLGSDYADVVPAVRILAILPILRAVHYVAADALTGAGRQRERAFVQLGVGAANIGANLVLIPLFGWRGAAAASLASDGLLGVVLWFLVVSKSRGEGIPAVGREP